MIETFLLLLLVYAAIKLASMALLKRPGFRRGEVRLTDRLRAREPGLLVLSCLIVVPLALLGTSYSQRTLAAQYEHSAHCYGQILALENVGAFRKAVGNYAFAEGVRIHASTAQVMARDLDMAPQDVDRALSGEVEAARTRYAALERQGLAEQMARERGKAQTCIHSPPGTRRG